MLIRVLAIRCDARFTSPGTLTAVHCSDADFRSDCPVVCDACVTTTAAPIRPCLALSSRTDCDEQGDRCVYVGEYPGEPHSCYPVGAAPCWAFFPDACPGGRCANQLGTANATVCRAAVTTTPVSCDPETEFFCAADQVCIDIAAYLNGVDDCSDGSDEPITTTTMEPSAVPTSSAAPTTALLGARQQACAECLALGPEFAFKHDDGSCVWATDCTNTPGVLCYSDPAGCIGMVYTASPSSSPTTAPTPAPSPSPTDAPHSSSPTPPPTRSPQTSSPTTSPTPAPTPDPQAVEECTIAPCMRACQGIGFLDVSWAWIPQCSWTRQGCVHGAHAPTEDGSSNITDPDYVGDCGTDETTEATASSTEPPTGEAELEEPAENTLFASTGQNIDAWSLGICIAAFVIVLAIAWKGGNYLGKRRSGSADLSSSMLPYSTSTDGTTTANSKYDEAGEPTIDLAGTATPVLETDVDAEDEGGIDAANTSIQDEDGLYKITIKRTDKAQKLGISFNATIDGSRYYVTGIRPGGLADEAGGLQTGMTLEMINGNLCANVKKSEIQQQLMQDELEIACRFDEAGYDRYIDERDASSRPKSVSTPPPPGRGTPPVVLAQPSPSQPSEPWRVPGELSKVNVDEILMQGSSGDGSFVIRDTIGNPNLAGTWTMSIVYRGKPTHHLVSRDASGTLLISKKDWSSGEWRNLGQLVASLSSNTLPPGWPVRLTVPCGNAKSTSEPPALPQRQQPGYPQAENLIHPPMSKQQADDLANDKLGGVDGNFFIRQRQEANNLQHVLTVIYKGRTTQHPATQTIEGSTIILNGHDTGTRSVPALIEMCRSQHKWWPVPLLDRLTTAGDMVRGVGGGGGGGVVPAPAPADDASNYISIAPATDTSSRAFSVDNSESWLCQAPIGKLEAQERLKGDDGSWEDGIFLVEATSTPDQYALNVNFKGRATRHKVAPNEHDGTLTINGKSLGPHTSIEGLIAALSSDNVPKGWPVKLTRPGRVTPGGQATPAREQRNNDSTPASPPPAPSSTSWLHGEISREEASGNFFLFLHVCAPARGRCTSLPSLTR